MYLGYNYQQELTKLTNRLTLLLQCELSLYFFSEVEITVNGEKEWLQGFSISSAKTFKDIDKALELITDLKCIHVNKRNSNSSEILFTICAKPDIMQKWYNDMYEGACSTAVCNKYLRGMKFTADDEEIDAFKVQWYATHANYSV